MNRFDSEEYKMSCGIAECNGEDFRISITARNKIVIFCNKCDGEVSRNMARWTRGLKK